MGAILSAADSNETARQRLGALTGLRGVGGLREFQSPCFARSRRDSRNISCTRSISFNHSCVTTGR